MKIELLCGPREYGVRIIHEPEDGLAGEALVARLQQAVDEANRAALAETAGRLLRAGLWFP